MKFAVKPKQNRVRSNIPNILGLGPCITDYMASIPISALISSTEINSHVLTWPAHVLTVNVVQ